MQDDNKHNQPGTSKTLLSGPYAVPNQCRVFLRPPCYLAGLALVQHNCNISCCTKRGVFTILHSTGVRGTGLSKATKRGIVHGTGNILASCPQR